MFTGIIEEVGVLREIRRGTRSAVLTIGCEKVLAGTKTGDSIAVNGVCLTATALGDHSFAADVMPETLNRSSLGSLRPGGRVNLERAMAADGRFGGHIVSGHIDGTGRIARIRPDDNAVWYTIAAEPKLLRYIVEKGSVALDGVSLTVARVTPYDFQVSVIPHTRQETTLTDRKINEAVNIECDLIGKYVERFLRQPEPAEYTMTEDFLKKFLM